MRPHPSTPTERVVWISYLLAHEGEYGVVSALARAIGVSRQSLTRWREDGRRALRARLAPERSTPVAVRRSILTLLVVGHTSYRGIQVCLADLLGVRVSLGTIARVVAEAGQRAAAMLQTQAPPAPVVLALDEIFGGAPRHGYLNAVDARSGVVWATAGPVVPSEATWRDLLSGLAAQGVTWSSAVHDGGKPAAAAVAALTPDVPRQRDIWHVLHRCAQAQARLERLVVDAEAKWERAERYAAIVASGGRPRHRPPAVPAAAQAVIVDAVAGTAADLRVLTGELQRLVEAVVVDGDRVLDGATRRAELATVLALVDDLAHAAPPPARPELTALHRTLGEVRDGLLVFADALDPIHRAMAARIGEAGLALVGWAWLRRTILGDGEALLAQFPPDWRPAAQVLITAWSRVVRASSAVEGWHSLLRPHLAVHRTLPAALLALVAVHHNHRVSPRGAHAGQSPLHRSGVTTAPTDWLAVLDAPAPARPPTPLGSLRDLRPIAA